MTPERWQKIEALYHAAQNGGPAVLEGTDPDLRYEVERLLAQDSQEKILDRDAAALLQDFRETQESRSVPTDLAGRTVANYQIREMLGAGGMGVVYKAFDTRLNRLVALKFLPSHMRHDEVLKRQLADEARAASALDHPNIVVIYDIEDSGDLFIAMAFHDGVTLREKIAQGLEVPEALRIARQIASGLAKAHENGIVHRDIKPGNIIVAKDGVARIIDFGLARSSDVTGTIDGTAKGTPLYMSPEQASGRAVDCRTDLWSLGAVLHEMLTGMPPFRGESQLQVMRAVISDTPPRVRELKSDLPAEAEAIVSRSLEKDPAKRYQSASEMVDDLSALLRTFDAPAARTGVRHVYAIPAAVLLLLAIGISIWFFRKSQDRLWAREAIPQINQLRNQDRQLAAFRILQEAQRRLPGDPQLAQIAEGLTHTVEVQSTPPGASVEIQDYLSPDDPWFTLGTTPIANVRIPNGYFRWRVSKPGVAGYVSAPATTGYDGLVPTFNFPLDVLKNAPDGMMPVDAVSFGVPVFSLEDLGPYKLPAFYVDRFEVTNRQYQEFVDQGGYQKREFWREKFINGGHQLTWEQAMGLFRDSSGRPGPSTWIAGHFPEGKADYPVGGVSWYEASAYAEFAGKSLPVIAQWYLAAPSDIARFIMSESNFSSQTAPVGKYAGVGPLGTSDMAGNVAEWCRNAAGGGTRYLLGGGANTVPYEYFEPGTQPEFHRAANAGFRCVRNMGPIPAEAAAERRLIMRDFSHAKPASDDLFRVYKDMYRYDRTPLNAKLETVAQDAPDWRKEKIAFDAAYGNERMAAYLFLPARVKPPYQTVVFFPTTHASDLTSSEKLADMPYIDFLIQSGRAVIYPVYKGTYERPAPPISLDTAAGRDRLIQDSKDIGRSIDYLETRADIDAKHIAFLGVSVGAALGVDWVAVEDRFKAAVWLDGGFYNTKPLPGTDQADFAPRVKVPTLLVAGKFDFIFMGKDAMVQLLGARDKRVFMVDSSHDVFEKRPEVVREVLAWLDRYLGKVN